MHHVASTILASAILLAVACGTADADLTSSDAGQHPPTTSTPRSDRPDIFENDAFARLLYDDGLGQTLDLTQSVGPATVSLRWAVALTSGRVMMYHTVEAAEGFSILPSALVDPVVTTADGRIVLGHAGSVGTGGGDFNGNQAVPAGTIESWGMPEPFPADMESVTLNLTIPAARVVPVGNPASPVTITPPPPDPTTMLTPTLESTDGVVHPDPALRLPGPFHFTIDVPVVSEEVIVDPTRTSQLEGAMLPDKAAVEEWVELNVEGQEGDPEIVEVELVTRRAAILRDQYGEWSIGTTGDPDSLVWEVEVQDSRVRHACPPSATNCYWDSRVIVLDAETGQWVGDRNPREPDIRGTFIPDPNVESLPVLTSEDEERVKEIALTDPRVHTIFAGHVYYIAPVWMWHKGLELIGGVADIALDGPSTVTGEWQLWSTPNCETNLEEDPVLVSYRATYAGLTSIHVRVNLHSGVVETVTPHGGDYHLIGEEEFTGEYKGITLCHRD